MVSKQQLFNQTKKLVKKAAANERRRPFNPNSTGSKIGSAIGSRYGPGGAALGMKAGDFLNRIVGKGDYTIQGNSLMRGNLQKSSQIPFFTPDGKRGLRVTEREYLGDIRSGALVSGSSGFSLDTFAINPGLASTFPWLSSLANNFDQWQPNGIVFEFRSTSSTFNGTSQALGTVIAATEYDVVDLPFSTKVEMENSDYAMSCAASESMIHAIECSPKERQRQLYSIRNGAVPSNDIQRNYDLANFQIATQGMSTAGVNLGELWVSYDITFYKKQLFTSLGNQILWTTMSAVNTAGALCDNNHWLGTPPVVPHGNYRPISVIDGAGTLGLEFPKTLAGSTFLLNLRTFSTSGIPFQPTATYANCVNEPAILTFNDAPAGTTLNFIIAVRVTNDLPWAITLSSGGIFATGPKSSFLSVTQMNPAMD